MGSVVARRRCVYLTMDDLSAFVSDADLSIPPMNALGWDVDMVSWRDAAVNWDDYALVYICTPWDYPDDASAFMRVLERIEQSRARLVNPLALVRWNLEKTYLRELERQGAAIVPSEWFDRFDAAGLAAAFPDADELVVKPVVGANASDTFVLQRPFDEDIVAKVATTFADKAYFVQPFVPAVRDEGEFSLFYFGGEYSHAILKVPKAGDFRSQEEHGAEILSADPPPELREAADFVHGLIAPVPTYLRADFVRDADDRFLLMELELIEPSLYFRTDTASAERFARALDAAAP